MNLAFITGSPLAPAGFLNPSSLLVFSISWLSI